MEYGLRSSATLLLVLAVSACATITPKFETELGKGRIAYAQAGGGSVAVVFVSGLGAGMDSWAPVFGPAAEMATAFAYDRPGYGGSDEVPGPRSGRVIVGELRELLTRVGLQPPYLLVGHSIAGQWLELFARLHPDEVGGVVLIDSRHPDFTRRCMETVREGCELKGVLRLLLPRPAKQEVDAAEETRQQLLHAPAFPQVPLVVITRGRGGESRAYLELWAETQREYTQLSDRSTLVVSAISGHRIHHDDPAIVIEALKRVVDEVVTHRRGGDL